MVLILRVIHSSVQTGRNIEMLGSRTWKSIAPTGVRYASNNAVKMFKKAIPLTERAERLHKAGFLTDLVS